MAIERITAAGMGTPAGHYVHATVACGLVHVSGQLPRDAAGSITPDAPFAEQAEVALGNLLTILAAAGCGPADVVKLNAYIVGIDHWPGFNAVMARMFGDARPARAVIPVPELHHGWLVEVDAVAAQPTK
jgi:enamine deaminase RidA (YjgF/YER057c/UK114 family)